jgi:hypothetical protein
MRWEQWPKQGAHMSKRKYVKFLAGLLFSLLIFFACGWLTLARPFVIQERKQGVEARADPKSLEFYTKKLSVEFSPRDFRHIDNLNQAAEWISETLKRNSQKVWFQEFTVNRAEYRNVISEYWSSNGNNQKTVVK